MKSIALSIFTNCTKSAPSTKIIERTYKSFCDTFGEIKPTVFMDINPNCDKSSEYKDNLLKLFPKIIATGSLSAGYVESIKNSSDDYLFQLEHDWIFDKSVIKHSLKEILEVMEAEQIYFFRFNKRQNLPAGWDTKITPMKSASGFDYCLCNNMSNNPHVINRKYYIENMLKYVKIVPSSKGIEENLNAAKKFQCSLYGKYGEFAAVHHLDGKRS